MTLPITSEYIHQSVDTLQHQAPVLSEYISAPNRIYLKERVSYGSIPRIR